ncbi:MAG: N-6 DNA methylase, partial [Defluviicoccus sp.]|nr:N-6 DNA methylase [Defluviicoccus sp.]
TKSARSGSAGHKKCQLGSRETVAARAAELDGAHPAERDDALRRVSGLPYYNLSGLALGGLGKRSGRRRLAADFAAYLDGFSPNVRGILDELGFRERAERLGETAALARLIRKFTAGDIHFGPDPVRHADGTIAETGLDEAAMRALFEELVRRGKAESGEGSGEHRTPRDAIGLMARLAFEPVAGNFRPGAYSLYDGACGIGEILDAAGERLRELARPNRGEVSIRLYGQEVNPDSYVSCKAGMLLAGRGDDACTIAGGEGRSAVSQDAFAAHQFDFMLSNPPHGRRWKAELDRMGGRKATRDARFAVHHAGDPGYSLLPRASDSQMLYLVNALAKMKRDTPLGSRIAEVHNGASLSTGDAGQGESNIRRWILENDWLEAIVALPSNIFYDTAIATYVWVLTNRKPARRRGRVQLIDASGWFRGLPRSVGKKSRELGEEHVARICEAFLAFEETEHSRILDNAAFGYRKVTVERPLRVEGVEPGRVHSADEIVRLRDHGRRRETASPVIAKIHGRGAAADPLRGLFAAEIGGRAAVVEYEPDAALRDTERVPLQEEGGIESFMEREVLPYAPDAWYRPDSEKIGYRIDFRRHFYRPEPMRGVDEIRAEILALERETGSLMENIFQGAGR